jgi:hypothetical protein
MLKMDLLLKIIQAQAVKTVKSNKCSYQVKFPKCIAFLGQYMLSLLAKFILPIGKQNLGEHSWEE